jgi:hypothetical protein
MSTMSLCHNPNLGFTTKARACKVVGQEGNPTITFHPPRCAKQCEGMNLHTPKWTFILDFWIFKGWLQGSKLIGLRHSLYHRKALGIWMSEMGSHDPFGHLKCKLWPKERSRVKLATTKSWESPRFPCVLVGYNTPLESFRQGLQLCLKPHLNWRYARKVISPQSREIPNFGNFRTPTWESRDKCHLDASPVANHRVYYKGESGGFPQVRAVMNLVSPSLPMAHPDTKNVPTMH